ncbi:MAG TPA: CBS domain-containing protein [Methanotrichaceae archaeon]|nr:CBS domain-containing protein [Methanotrichaceae archaeon]
MKVRDVMNAKPITVQAKDSVTVAAKRMKENKISGMPVMDSDHLEGVISESDLLRLLSVEEDGQLWLPSPLEVFEVPIRDFLRWEKLQRGPENLAKIKVSEVMSKNIQAVNPEDSVEDAAQIMTKHRINRLPVLENDRLVGIVTRGDIIAGLGGSHEKD